MDITHHALLSTAMTLPKIADSPDPRIPRILEERLQGATWEQSGATVGMSVRSVYNLRQSQEGEFKFILDTLAPLADKKLEEYINHEQVTVSMEAIKETNRMRRALITRRTSHTEDIKLTADLTITEKRKEKDQLIKSLELTPDQYRILEDTFKTEEGT